MTPLVVFSRNQRLVSIMGLSFLLPGLILMIIKISFYNPGINIIWLLPLQLFIAILTADFLSGLVHFLGDNPITQNRWLDKWFYNAFYIHHLEPTEMMAHDLVDTTGTSAIGVLIIISPSLYFLPKPHDLLSMSLCLFVFFFSLMLFMTNQIHKWAHTSKPPKLVVLLQKYNFILNPRNHIKHHIKHDRYYCITTGWWNAFFFKIKFWEKMTGLGLRNKG